MLPFYKIVLDEDNEGMDFIALVDNPAHMKSFQSFNKKKPIKTHFNEEKRIVTGVAIATDLPIYRNDMEIGEHYVVFSKEETFKIAKKMIASGFANNVNSMHDSNKQLKGVTLIESFILDGSRGNVAPEMFANQNLKEGSWITSYHVDNIEAWEGIKSGKYAGFSIEGWFGKKEINIKNKKKMNKKETSLFKKIFGKNKFTEAMTIEGDTVVFDGEELVAGIELRVKTDEEETLAPEGSHVIEFNEMTFNIVVDGNGIITSVEEVLVGESEDTSDVEAVLQEMRKEFKAELKAELENANIAFEARTKDLESKIEKLVVELDAKDKPKFNKPAKAVEGKVNNWKTIVKK